MGLVWKYNSDLKPNQPYMWYQGAVEIVCRWTLYKLPLYTNIWLIPTSLTSSEKMKKFGWFVVVVRHGQLDKHWSLHQILLLHESPKLPHWIHVWKKNWQTSKIKPKVQTSHHTTPHHTTSTLLLFFSFFSSSSQFFLLLPSASTGSKGKRCKQNQHHLGTYHAHNVDCQLKFLLPFAGEGEKELRMAPIPHPGSAQNTNTLEENGTVALKHQYSWGERNSCSKTPILLRRTEQLL